MQRERLARILATWFGCGRSPIAPGTVGTLGALPLHLALRAAGPIPYAVAVTAVSVAGIWAAQQEAERLEAKDPQTVVIDEVAGVLVALLIASGRGFKADVLAVILFRVLDITKPGPIESLEHLEPRGLGIMADDLLAGLVAGVSARWLARFLG